MIETSSNSTPPPPFSPPPRRKRSPARTWSLLALWFVLLGGMMFFVSRMSDVVTRPQISGGGNPSGPPTPKMDMRAVMQKWSAIKSHAVAPARGPANAPYTMVEFGDFQCPFCGKIRPTVEGILHQSPNAVNLMFVHMTWPQHTFAIPAAQAANAAALQGKFWPMYDQLFSHQDDLEPGFYDDYAKAVGLDVTKFRQAANSLEARKQVVDSTTFSEALGINSTPSFLLRDNKTGEITLYVGADKKGTKMADGTIKDTLGLKDLTAALPWANKQ